MNFYGKIFLLLLFLNGACIASAQDNVSDLASGSGNYHANFQIWTGVKINKDFKYGISLSGSYLLRTDVSNRMVGGHYFYASLKYKALKYIHFDFKFRGVNSFQNNSYRFEIGVKPRYKYKKWTFALRTAYFNDREYFASTYERGRYPVNYWRNRLEVSWEFKKDWNAYVSAEVYTLFDYLGARVRRVALIGGVDYTFKKMHNIDVYYMAQPDFNKKNLRVVQALALVYTWDVPKKFKKKKK
ncbi:MAG TPA: DUF2490 domain-containing protein [Chitinophagales bacterium]|nr:DUF2490 domain-containing protein [Chitinophagales bacterium]